MNIIQRSLVAAMLLTFMQAADGQTRREDIYSASVLYQNRVSLEKDLRERITGRNMSLPLDSNTEDKYLSACWAIAQFLIYTPEVEHGLDTLFNGYSTLSYDTKKALLEATYAVAPKRYIPAVQHVLEQEEDPKLFSMCAVYLYRADTSTENSNALKIRMVEKFPGYDSLAILQELAGYLSYHGQLAKNKTPDLSSLFAYQRARKQKTIYSFQRWSRDYPGLAVVQDENGQFVRDGQKRLQVFQQLARSGSDLPYFITDGSTPQGIYSIRGTDVSRISFIGPTTNLQLVMPFEGTWERYFHLDNDTALMEETIDSLRLYQDLLPSGWRSYTPMMEAWSAGRIGRTEIIAHGTTIDPEYFKDKPFYPLTPTMGCLCAKELWNPTNGHPLVSEQLNLVSAFLSTPGRKGYLYVINVDDRHTPVSRAEVEAWISKWEGKSVPLVH
jgi:hypothetical protein